MANLISSNRGAAPETQYIQLLQWVYLRLFLSLPTLCSITLMLSSLVCKACVSEPCVKC